MTDEIKKDTTHLLFDCSLVLSFRKRFFSGSIPPRIEDKLINHLLNCKECKKAYQDYAKTIGYKTFNTERYALKFFKDHPPNETECTKEALVKIKNNMLEEALSQKWTRAALDYNITQLMQMKAFRELSLEYNSPTGEDYTEFYKFLAKKIAQKVDYLEVCLFKEYKKGDTKANEKSK